MGFPDCVRHRVEYGDIPLELVFLVPCVVGPSLSRRHAGHDIGAVVQHLLRMKRSLAAGDALNDETRRFADKYTHGGGA